MLCVCLCAARLLAVRSAAQAPNTAKESTCNTFPVLWLELAHAHTPHTRAHTPTPTPTPTHPHPHTHSLILTHTHRHTHTHDFPAASHAKMHSHTALMSSRTHTPTSAAVTSQLSGKPALVTSCVERYMSTTAELPALGPSHLPLQASSPTGAHSPQALISDTVNLRFSLLKCASPCASLPFGLWRLLARDLQTHRDAAVTFHQTSGACSLDSCSLFWTPGSPPHHPALCILPPGPHIHSQVLRS